MNAEHATAYLFLLIAIVVSCAIPFFGEKIRARRLARQYAPLLTMPVEECIYKKNVDKDYDCKWSDSVMINLDNIEWDYVPSR